VCFFSGCDLLGLHWAANIVFRCEPVSLESAI